ncbi:hypothetical protein MR818_00485 [bacterium]|nr:hypothetical protein [bacterium]
MEKEKEKASFTVVNHRKNGEEFNPESFVLPYDITKALIEAISLPVFVLGSSEAMEV